MRTLHHRALLALHLPPTPPLLPPQHIAPWDGKSGAAVDAALRGVASEFGTTPAVVTALADKLDVS